MSQMCPSWWGKVQKDGTLSKDATSKEKRDYAVYQRNIKSGGQKKATSRSDKPRVDV